MPRLNKRPDGRYQKKVYIGRDKDGKRNYKDVYGSTQKEVEEKAFEIKVSMKKGIDVSAERDTFCTWADKWLKLKNKSVSDARLVVLKSHIKHLKRYLEYGQITKIRPVDIQEVIDDLSVMNPNTGRPMAKETLSGLKRVAIQIFQYAIENRVMDYNPAQALEVKGGQARQNRRALTQIEQTWITDTPHRAQCAAMLMMLAGVRRGELIPLMWSDINLKARTINVDKAVEKVDGAFVIIDGTKRRRSNVERSKRVVDIPQKLADFLAGEPRESIYVCLSADKKMHTPDSWDSMWDSYLADLNFKYGDFSSYLKRPKSKFDPGGVPFVIPRFTAHWLRHTFCTIMYLAGVDLLTAKYQMGHKDIKTTLGIYTHLDEIHKRKSMDKIDDYLDDARHMHVSG